MRIWKTVVSRLALITILSAILFFLITLFIFRHYIWNNLPLWATTVSLPVVQSMRRHPHLAHFMHVLINAVPDIAYALLAVAGLSYLMPVIARRLEAKRGVRYILLTFFSTIGCLAIYVNAVNHTDQDQNQIIQSQVQGRVLTSVLEIQSSLHSNKILSETQRRKSLSDSLKDEYVLSHNPVDPEILAGTKMPPTVWMNTRLNEMGEIWKVANEEPITKPVVMQEIPSEPKRAKIVFSFKQNILNQDNLLTTIEDPMIGNKVSVTITAFVVGDTPAENVMIWIRKCDECEWISPNPSGFLDNNLGVSHDRMISFPELLPNVVPGMWDFTIQMPLSPGIPKHNYNAMAISCYYACKNCLPIDPNKPQILLVNQPVIRYKMQYPLIPFTPVPVQK